MDSKLCLWPSSGTRCIDLTGHNESISCVMAGDDGTHIISTSYDKSIIIWDTRTKRQCEKMLGHKYIILIIFRAPILCVDWNDGYLTTGDRGGVAALWDLNQGKNSAKLTGHKGHLTSIRIMPPDAYDTSLIFTGAQDGNVKIWDPRDTTTCVKSMPLHGKGAVGNIEV